MLESAGIICYRHKDNQIEFLVGHPGGPYWSGKNKDKWGIPKGQVESGEHPFHSAIREFEEETGLTLPTHNIDDFILLGYAKQNKHKNLYVYAFEWNNLDINNCKSNMCDIEFPPKSGKIISISEMDKYMWITETDIENKIFKGQIQFFNKLIKILSCYGNDI